ncbi:MAG: DNA-directed RNA polymerase subunit beta' [Candidatus Sumerlaeaceae bacterium]|nr:DNA-directed RNA polymerase subunit beta' [Candidatus Sumerlaeaceae bacterium]
MSRNAGADSAKARYRTIATKKAASKSEKAAKPAKTRATKRTKDAGEILAFQGVREIDEVAPPNYRPIPLGSEKDDDVDLNTVNTIARISIASPERILAWSRRHSRAAERRLGMPGARLAEDLDLSSFGEVKKPETINYRTFKPEKDGLFCERIFGPTKDWECACGKYKRIKYKGIVCDRCGVEVIESKVRRTRMGHIKLAAPVCHIWFYKGTSSRISQLLDISVKDLGKVIYFQNHIIVDCAPELPLKPKQLLADDEVRKYREMYGDKVDIRIGAEAVKELLKQIEIEELSGKLAIEMRQATSAQKRQKIIKRLKVVEAFRGSSNKPEWMVLEVLPVIPPELRPLVHLDGGRFATSDLNDLYRRVINRNNRLKKLMELKAPEVILRNEKRMLQEAVDALFDNSRRTRPTKGHNNRPLKSLSDMLKGKQGRFRQNLLGKRVDYSGRSVIVVGPELKFNECGLPKKMALELFDPFIIRELERRGYVNTIKSAKKMMEREAPEVYDILDDIIKDHPVLLNRAPTLHRLGVQAFMPKLVEGKAIQLHPLACAAFNADFDGDQMAVHVPLSTEAKLEAKNLMLAENNILSPATGKPIATPTQDMVLGLFYMTKVVPNDERYAGAKNDKDRERLVPRFSSPEEAVMALNHKQIKLHEEILVRQHDGRKVKTSAGRTLIASVLPPEVDYYDAANSFANQVLTKGQLSQLVHAAHKRVGKTATAIMLDNLKGLGYYYAKRGGISISMNDMVIPPSKHKILDAARKRVEEVQKHYSRGLVTFGERYSKIIHEWSLATDQVAADMMVEMQRDQRGLNPIFIMSTSGARGNEAQIRQLAGMRGLMQKPTKKITGDVGEIIESPIISNFREGLTVLEYFISTHGARKGLADTALKTSDAGYLTRRLVDVAQDLFITEEDCGTQDSITVAAITEITRTGERELEPLSDRIAGRVTSKDVVDPATGKVIVKKNTDISDEKAKEIEKAGIVSVKIRSVLTCRTRRGICAKCYGRNMATGRMVELGEAVGVISAQSIGEPGTQLTLRTFHIGGTASIQVEGWYQASHDGTIRFNDLKTIASAEGGLVVVNRSGSLTLEGAGGVSLQKLPSIPYGARLLVKNGASVKRGDRLVEWDPHFTPIMAEVDGVSRLVDITAGVTMKEELDPVSEKTQRFISEHREEKHPQIQVTDSKGNVMAQYALSSGTILMPELTDGGKVKAGQVLARIPRARTKSKDITGGLPRVDELFEARKPKDAAVIAEIDGVIHIKGSAKGARKFTITADNGEEKQYSIPVSRHLVVRDGERVQRGDIITDGTPSPHDILAVNGEKAVMEFLVTEVQEVYRLQKVNINDKHIECIVRQMLKKVIVEEVGNTRFLYGQQVDKWEFEEENAVTAAKGGTIAKGRPKLLGLTKASLETESFISAASFQETTRVLTDAAVRGRYDFLRGLKENVIMGLLVPAGTGLPVYRNIDVKPKHEEEPEPEQAEETAEV